MFLIFIVERIGAKFYWDYTIWWFDILKHFWGGFWVGLFAIYIFYTSDPSARLIFKIFLWVLLVGILWEIFEFWTNNFIGQIPFSIPDTLSDIFFDLAGGLSAVFFYIKKITPVQEKLL